MLIREWLGGFRYLRCRFAHQWGEDQKVYEEDGDAAIHVETYHECGRCGGAEVIWRWSDAA